MKLRIHGAYDSEGNLQPWLMPCDGVLFNNTIRDPTDGAVWAMKDEYGDWVCPIMRKWGVRRVLKVEEL